MRPTLIAPTLIAPALVALILLLVLAARPGPARAADGGLRTATQLDLRTRYYPGETEDNVLEQITTVFELAQADYRILYGKHGVIAYRKWGWETMADEELGFGGRAYWYADVERQPGGVQVRVRAIPAADPHTPLDPKEHEGRPGRLVSQLTLMPEDPLPDEDVEAEALYAVFFNRLDVLLGQNRFWLYCRAAEEYAKMEGLRGGLDAWCVDAGDARPGALLGD